MMSRNTTYLLIAATTLLSASAQASPIGVLQTGSGGSVRTSTRCSSCSTQADRRYREQLMLRIDSLRWQIENRRLSDAERARASEQLHEAVLALQKSLDETARAVTVEVTTAPVRARASTTPQAAEQATAYAYAVPRVRARGYLGVTFDGPSAEMTRPGEHVIRFYKYPRIALVEPSSPAERAGVLQEDTLLAFNGVDIVSNEFNLTKLLVPDAKIVMRVRRDGGSKDLNVTVGEAPEYYARRRVQVAPFPPLPGGERRPDVRGRTAVPPDGPGAPVTVWIDMDGIAGARVETISEGLAKAVGVEQGVLVVRASPGTPAYRSGLRAGDVIVRADGENVPGLPMLRNVLGAADGDEGVKLLIIRERKTKDITLRW